MSKQPKILNWKDVVTLEERAYSLNAHAKTFKVIEFFQELFNILSNSSTRSSVAKNWCGSGDNGMPCEVLVSGGSWQKGKICLRLEFIPDEPELTVEGDPKESPESEDHSDSSPLDDIRQAINQEEV